MSILDQDYFRDRLRAVQFDINVTRARLVNVADRMTHARQRFMLGKWNQAQLNQILQLERIKRDRRRARLAVLELERHKWQEAIDKNVLKRQSRPFSSRNARRDSRRSTPASSVTPIASHELNY